MQEKSAPKTPKTKLQPTFDYLFQQISLMSMLSDKSFKLLLTACWEKTTQVRRLYCVYRVSYSRFIVPARGVVNASDRCRQ